MGDLFATWDPGRHLIDYGRAVACAYGRGRSNARLHSPSKPWFPATAV